MNSYGSPCCCHVKTECGPSSWPKLNLCPSTSMFLQSRLIEATGVTRRARENSAAVAADLTTADGLAGDSFMVQRGVGRPLGNDARRGGGPKSEDRTGSPGSRIGTRIVFKVGLERGSVDGVGWVANQIIRVDEQRRRDSELVIKCQVSHASSHFRKFGPSPPRLSLVINSDDYRWG